MTKSQGPRLINSDSPLGSSSFYKYIPNSLTILRILCTPIIIWMIAKNQFISAFWVFFAVSATDWLDGYLARRWQVTSRLGQILDPLADKFLLISLYLFLGLWGFVPLWLTILVLLRDFLILTIGGVIIFTHKEEIRLLPQLMGKISTTLQMLLVGLILVSEAPVSSIPTSSILNSLMVFLLYIVAFTTILSGITYAKVVVRRFQG
jgi:cardiolipin synthase